MAVILQVVSPPRRGSVVSHEGHLHNRAAVVPSYPTDKANNCPFFFPFLPLLVKLAKLRLRRKPGYCQEWCQMVTVRGAGLFGTKGQLWAGGLWFQTTPDQRCAPASLLLCLCPWSVPDATKRATRSPEVGNDKKRETSEESYCTTLLWFEFKKKETETRWNRANIWKILEIPVWDMAKGWS